MLTWRDLALSFLQLGRLSFRIVFHRKLLFMGLGILVYYGILYALAILRPGEGFSVDQALYVLVEIPGTVLAIYLAMDLVVGERERNTLEILFSTSTPHYGIWMVRLVAVYGVLAGTLLIMGALAFLLFAELPLVWGPLNAFLPAFLLVNLTFFFSILTRSSNTAGMLSLGLIIAVLLTSQSLSETPYYLFLNPFHPPVNADASGWREMVLLNRLGIAGAGAFLLFLGLRKMAHRERLLS